jgi:hypothetical protein
MGNGALKPMYVISTLTREQRPPWSASRARQHSQRRLLACGKGDGLFQALSFIVSLLLTSVDKIDQSVQRMWRDDAATAEAVFQPLTPHLCTSAAGLSIIIMHFFDLHSSTTTNCRPTPSTLNLFG